MLSVGEIVRLREPLHWNRGQIVGSDGEPVFDRLLIASDAVIVDLNYTTGLAWTQPAFIGYVFE